MAFTDAQSAALSAVLDYLRKDALGTGQLDERAATKLSELWEPLGYRGQLDFLNHLRDEPILSLLKSVSLLSSHSSDTVQDFGISWEPKNLELGSLIGLFAYDNADGLPGITSLTIDHTTNREGYDFENCPDLVSLTFSNLTTVTEGGYINVSGCPVLEHLNFPNLSALGDTHIRLDTCMALLSLAFPKLINGGLRFSGCNLSGGLDISNLESSGIFSVDSSGLPLFSAPSLTDAFQFFLTNNAALTSVSLPVLQSTGNLLNISGNEILTSLSFPSLVTVGTGGSGDSNLDIRNDGLSSVSLPSLVTIAGAFYVYGDALLTISVPTLLTVGNGCIFENSPALTTINLPGLTSLGSPSTGFVCGNCPLLTTVTITSLVPENGNNFVFVNDALGASSVNSILARCVSSVGYVSGTIDLSGGTNAAPTGQGIIDKATLIGRGVTVNTN